MAENIDERKLEEIFAQMEEIIEKLDDEELSLEDAFALYEQGMRNIKSCNEKIEKVEQKMLALNETLELEEF